jgi:hypothetical protein
MKMRVSIIGLSAVAAIIGGGWFGAQNPLLPVRILAAMLAASSDVRKPTS